MTTYYDRFEDNETTKRWNKVDFVAGRVLQSAEMNEIQSIINHKLSQIGEAIWDEGDLVSGHDFNITTVSTSAGDVPAVEIAEGLLFIEGAVRLVSGTPSGSPIQITGTGEEVIGVDITKTYITENADSTLRDPAEGFDNYNTPGAHRERLDFTWKLCTGDGSDGVVPVVRILDGEPKLINVPSLYSDVINVMNRRTYDESGNYTVNEFPLHLVWKTTNSVATLEIDEGKAYVEGVEIQTGGTRRIDITVNNNYDSVAIETVDSYQDTQRLYELDMDYVKSVSQLSAQVTGTVTLTRDTGSTDNILTAAQSQLSANISSLVDIRGVAKGTSLVYDFDTDTWSGSGVTDYDETTDWLQSGPNIDWSPTGSEPSTGETYKIACYFDQVLTQGVRTLTTVTNEAVVKNGYLGVPVNLTVVPSTSASPSGSYYMYQVTAITDLGETTPITETTLLGPAITSATEYNVLDWDPPVNNGNPNVPTLTGFRIYRNYPNTRIMGLLKEVSSVTYSYTDDGTDSLNYNYLPPTRNTTNRDSLAHVDIESIAAIGDAADGGSDYSAGTDYVIIKGNDPGITNVPSKIYATEIGEGIVDWISTTTIPASGDTYYVSYTYWSHSTEGDYVCADSYSDFTKAPTYVDRSNNLVKRLTDYIDFRTTGTHPREGDDPVAIYDYYLGRIDLIYLKSEGDFAAVTGSATNYPAKPTIPNRTLPIAFITIPPYVYDVKEMSISTYPSKRYTMLDIRKLEKRIATLEYYQATDKLDREAIEAEVDSTESRRGIFTDLFTGHGKADVFHPNYNCAIDGASQELMLPFSMGHTDGNSYLDLVASTVEKNDRTITLPFDETVFMTQPFATEAVNVNPYDVFDWSGYIRLSPESDTWVDTTTLPDLYVNFEGNNTNYQSQTLWSTTNWGEWKNISSGFITQNEFTQNVQEVQDLLSVMDASERAVFLSSMQGSATAWRYNIDQRTGETTSITTEPEKITKSIGDRVLDVSKATWIRSKVITVSGNSFKPNHDLKVYFENTEMDVYSSVTGDLGVSGSTKVTTDSSGDFVCKFLIPSATFKTGIRTVRVESADGSDESYGEAKYTAEGLIQTKQSTFMTVVNNNISVRKSALVQYDANGNPIYPPEPPYSDPLAQTFYNDSDVVFLSSIDLYFYSKDASIPVTVEIRTVVNGYPSGEILGTAKVNASAVNVSSDGSTATNFTFTDPVVLDPNTEYCFVIWAKTTNYNVWVCKVGSVDVSTGNRVIKQPSTGVFLQSSNGSTWSADQLKDIKFKLYRCNYENTAQLAFSNITGIQAFLFVLNTTQMLPPGATVSWSYSTNNGTTWNPFEPLLDTSLSTVFTQIKLKAEFGGVDTKISPLVNSDRFGIITVLYQSSGSYVSKRQDFTDACYEIHMYLDRRLSSQTIDVKVELNSSGEFLSLGSATDNVVTTYDSNFYESYWSRPINDVGVLPAYNSSYANQFYYETSTGKTYYGNSATGSWKELTYIVNGEFDSIRVMVDMSTSSQAISPKAKRLRLICNGP